MSGSEIFGDMLIAEFSAMAEIANTLSLEG